MRESGFSLSGRGWKRMGPFRFAAGAGRTAEKKGPEKRTILVKKMTNKIRFGTAQREEFHRRAA